MADTRLDTPDLHTLIELFYPTPENLAEFSEIDAADLPADYRTLLAHENHMTVTVERFHHSPVDVQVLETRLTGDHYARKILLSRQSDGRVVQFGIVRLNFEYVSPAVRREVESQKTPLGRILIQHKVLREIHLTKLWRVAAGPDLAKLFGITPGAVAYGRTALIDCNSEPAVELLEIVTPVE